MTDALALFELLVERHLEPFPGFVGAVLVGSRVHDEHRETSDVDCLLIFEEVDVADRVAGERIIPGEFVWVPDDDSFHSIFEIDAAAAGGVQVDAIGRRLSWREFSTGEWKEGLKHDLAKRRVVFERGHDVTAVIAERTAYDEDVRSQRLAETTSWADYHLTPWRLEGWIDRGGIIGAHDQLDAAFEELVKSLHAYNRAWLPWRYRLLMSALKLAWLPDGFREAIETLRTPNTADAIEVRRAVLSGLLDGLMGRLERDGLVSDLRQRQATPFAGLGFASSMDAWRTAHAEWVRDTSSPE